MHEEGRDKVSEATGDLGEDSLFLTKPGALECLL